MSRRSSSSRKVVWDEENLKENEEIQKEYSAVRIQEPKTPYRPPLASDSLEDEMRPLQLDEVANALGPDRMTAFEYVMSNGGAAYNGAGSAQQQEQHQPAQQQEQPQQQPPPAVLSASISNASSELDGDRVMQDALGDKRSEPCTSFTSSGSEGSADKRQKFEQMRKQHYNMRDALVKAKHLLDTEDEDDAGGPGPDPDQEDEEGEEADTANCQNCNGMAVDSADKQPAATQQRSLQGAAQQPSQQDQHGGTSSSAQHVEVHHS